MSRTATDELWVARLGQVPYAEAVAIQHRLRAARQAGELPDMLLLLEHPPVYTLGRRGEPDRPADGRGLVPHARASTWSAATAAGG